MRKCYFETYRLSEDLDFTVVKGGPEEPAELIPLFEGISARLYEDTGLKLEIGETTFARKRNKRDNDTTQGRLAFEGPNRPPQLPKIKIDITSDEAVVDEPAARPITHPYSDTLGIDAVRCYPLSELFAEKIRALAERCRPRDLYDVIHIFRHPELLGQADLVARALARKCEFAGIAVPTDVSLIDPTAKAELEQEWQNMLAHQLPHLPPVDEFWTELPQVFDWLRTGQRPERLEPMAVAADVTDWRPLPGMTSWREGVPIELIRFAGANRLKIEIDYRAQDGRWGPRVVEPYSLRRTRDGNLLLYVVNDRGQVRGYRMDRIAGVRVTSQPFTPRFFVEF